MIIKKEGYNIVIVGGWNKSIFTPQWVSSKLFKKSGILYEFPLNINAPPRYTDNEVRLFIETNKIILSALVPSDENLNKIEQLAINVVELLPHTPVISFGINFGFVEDIEKSSILNNFNINDNADITEIMGEIIETNITRTIKIENVLLNFNIIKNQQKISIDFNIHFTINEALDVKNIFIKKSFIKYKNEILSILKNLYDLEPSTEEENL